MENSVSARYDNLIKQIKSWKKQNQDKNILNGLFYLCNPNHIKLTDGLKSIKDKTVFSDLDDNDFLKLFDKNVFNVLNDDELRHAFQELHNRYMTERNFDVTRNVVVKYEDNPNIFGYVTTENDVMVINKTAIEKAMKAKPGKSLLTKNNLGLSLFFILSHESQHLCQFESGIDFIQKNAQDDETAFIGAVACMEQSNFAYAQSNASVMYMLKWRFNYSNHFVEHNANYTAMKSVDSKLSDEQKDTTDYYSYKTFAGMTSLRSMYYRPPTFTQERAKKIEKFLKYELNYFEKNMSDCELKKQISDCINNYMKVDENGNSKLSELLNKQIEEIRLQTIEAGYGKKEFNEKSL